MGRFLLLKGASLTLIVILSVPALNARIAGFKESNSSITRCETLDYLKCGDNHPDGVPCIPEIRDCEVPEPGKRAHCFALWKPGNGSGDVIQPLKKGCWLDSKECYDRFECIGTRRHTKGDMNFCCCEGDLCNKHLSFDPTSPEELEDSIRNYPFGLPSSYHESDVADHPSGFTISLYIILGALVISVGLIVLLLYRRQKPMQYFDQIPVETAISPFPPTLKPHVLAAIASNGPYRGGPIFDSNGDIQPELNSANNTHFLELKARGRFGAVWRAQCGNRIIAVKTFSIQEKESWKRELEIYGLPNMKHPNVLEFLGAEIRGEGLQREFWILSTFHADGSLCDFLRSHTVTVEQLTTILTGLTAGLNHLHDDMCAGHSSIGNSGFKPSIAHRDFKSKNVLVKSDLTVCVADFGLALVFYPNRNIGDVHGQVGTKRYMAPEVLEGAINFTRDCFLRIDMYACGLVMWEVLSRCVDCYENEMPEYRMPFEEELGLHPTLEEMQDAVVGRGMRPKIPPVALTHPVLSQYCATMEECWDADIEARLSASCVGVRIANMSRGSNHRYTDTSYVPSSGAVGVVRGVSGMSISGESTLTTSLLLSSAENSASNDTGLGAPRTLHFSGSSGPPPYALRDGPPRAI